MRYTHRYFIKLNLIRHCNFCFWCCKTLNTKTATLEHLIPLQYNGEDNENNIVIACKYCNWERGQITEFIALVKKLAQEELKNPTYYVNRTLKRYNKLGTLCEKWHNLHLKKCPSIACDVHQLINTFIKSI